MRYMVLMAFVALQLSVFTCGFNIHVHAMGSDMGHVAEHQHGNNQHEPAAADHACHVHTSHTFASLDAGYMEHIPLVSSTVYMVLSSPNLKDLAFLIEYPPKTNQS